MSEQEIIEGNKLITKFLYENLYEDDGIDSWVEENGKVLFYLEDAKYHSSWDWLMPVVEKIGNLKSLEKDGEWFNFIIQNGKVPTNTYYTHIGRVGEYSRNLGNVSSGKSSSLIESIWLCVVEFIKWYNLCQKEK